MYNGMVVNALEGMNTELFLAWECPNIHFYFLICLILLLVIGL